MGLVATKLGLLVKLEENVKFIGLMLLLTAFFLFLIRKFKGKKDRDKITFMDSVVVGLCQMISIIPGISRSGATIVGALLIGVSRTVAAEFTFFLAVPVMFGASLLKLVKFGFAFTASELVLLIIGMLVAFVVSMITIKFLMSYIKKHDFKVFGWYRIILGIIVLIYFMIF